MNESDEKLLQDLYLNKHIHNAKDLKAATGGRFGVAKLSNWLKKQEPRQIQGTPAKNKRPLRHALYSKPFEVSQMDLIDLTGVMVRGPKFVLTLIDCFSRFAFAVPLIEKSAAQVLKAMEIIVPTIRASNPTAIIQADNGTEFKNSLVKDYLNKQGVTVRWSNAYSPASNGCIERFNGTVKRVLFEAMKANDTSNWTQLLPEVMHS
jgi:transposase InsO family protein